MTREEQIIKIGAQFAIDETDGQTSGRAASMRGVLLSAFRAGAHWADQHPNWIPVEERKPPIAYHDDLSENYLVVDSDGELLIAYYDAKNKLWFSVDSNPKIYDVTHWMPIVPPRKEK